MLPDDPVTLARSLETLAVDPELRRSMGTSGRRRASEVFGLSRMVDATLAVYREVIPERKRDRPFPVSASLDAPA